MLAATSSTVINKARSLIVDYVPATAAAYLLPADSDAATTAPAALSPATRAACRSALEALRALVRGTERGSSRLDHTAQAAQAYLFAAAKSLPAADPSLEFPRNALVRAAATLQPIISSADESVDLESAVRAVLDDLVRALGPAALSALLDDTDDEYDAAYVRDNASRSPSPAEVAPRLRENGRDCEDTTGSDESDNDGTASLDSAVATE
ncbi:hypothetical protein H9P43_004783 [Blastocladiella emersonii ATCC 22665]|nr:hypothetical protein H9P43_004783 [Blastocladiella emersonii ATCC 22665]